MPSFSFPAPFGESHGDFVRNTKEEGEGSFASVGDDDRPGGPVLPDLDGVDVDARGRHAPAIITAVPRESVLGAVEHKARHASAAQVADFGLDGQAGDAGVELEETDVVERIAVGSEN